MVSAPCFWHLPLAYKTILLIRKEHIPKTYMPSVGRVLKEISGPDQSNFISDRVFVSVTFQTILFQ